MSEIAKARVYTDYTKPFEGRDGTVYELDHITAGRLAYCQLKMLELLSCESAIKVQERNSEILQACNDGNLADVVVLVHNASKGVESLANRSDTVMMYCAAIFNSAGEDIGVVDEIGFREKIKNWGDIDIDFFFTAALGTIAGLIASWRKLVHSSSAAKEELGRLLYNLQEIQTSGGTNSST